MKVVVVTTINPPTEAIYKLLTHEDWYIIIVGDIKTPHNLYYDIKRNNYEYLGPLAQEKMYPALSNVIGWNTSLRRNLGFVRAHELGAEIMGMLDDDNIPYAEWGKDLKIGEEIEVDLYTSTSFVFNPLSVVSRHLWQRGFPIQLLKSSKPTWVGKTKIVPQVQACLWDGEADIDAIERIAFEETSIDPRFLPFACDRIVPFNSQNTFMAREVIPWFFLLPEIGRVDDIWGSYHAQTRLWGDMKVKPIVFTHPTVFQRRNPHDLVKDLKDELYSYNTAIDFVAGGCQLPPAAQTMFKIYQDSFKR